MDILSFAIGQKSAGGGGGGDDFVVTVTESSGTYSADKTLQEINDALDAGKRVRAVLESGQTSWYFDCVQKNNYGTSFTTVDYSGDAATAKSIYISNFYGVEVESFTWTLSSSS